MQSANYKQLLHLHLIVFIWGFTALFGKLITLDALPLVWVRIGIAIVGLGGYVMLTKHTLNISRKNVLVFLVSGVVIALHWLTFFYAVKISNVSITLAGLSTGAFFTALLEPLFLKRRIVIYEVLLGIFVIIGLLLIFSVETQYFWGIVTALISALLSAVFTIINALHIKKESSLSISFYELLGGFLFLSIVLLFNQDFSFLTTNIFETDIYWLLVLGLLCTAYPFIVTVGLMKYISPYTMMLTINLEPVYGIIIAYLIFPESEQMSPKFYVGAGVILATILLNGYFKNRKKLKLNKKKVYL